MTDTSGSVIISPKPIIGITLGDFNGIGPEITLKSLLSPQVKQACIPVLIGPQEIFSFYCGTLNLPVTLEEIIHPKFSLSSKNISIINIEGKKKLHITPGRFSRQSGTLAGASIFNAASFCVNGDLDAIVTAPVSKEALHSAGYRFPGQTEMLAKYSHSQNAVMMFVNGSTRVALATIHIPVGRIVKSLTKKLLTTNLTTIISSLASDFGISSPRIAILGLNPHAGENGTIGREEQEIIIPVLRRFQKTGYRVEGPFPADGFWGKDRYSEYDITVAMYHDQGLIPFKMRFFSTGVNYSAGLSIIRSSPDHGTAFDIAGKGQADPRSMIQAIKLAAQIAKRRKHL
jgi:4-hydroxythreonine-4-phosphate dehydrogenase